MWLAIGMTSHAPLDTLSIEERDRVREIIDEQGKQSALRFLGLRDMLALMTAIAGYPVHRLTTITIREHLRGGMTFSAPA